MQRDFERPGHTQIVFERPGLVHHHIRSRGRETLIRDHIGRSHILLNVTHERNRLVRIADILIEKVDRT